jgi:glycosyltransferase involved in cell wall biosynthesis
MRVLHLVADLGQGGAEKQLTLLCGASVGVAEHHVVAVRGLGFHANKFRELGIPLECLGAQRPYSLGPLWTLPHLIRRMRPDILHCWLPSMNLLGGVASALAVPHRPRVVATIRNVDNWKSACRIALDRAASVLWDRVLCNSQAGLECARQQGIASRKLFWVPNGVEQRQPIDAAEREDLRRQYGVPDGGVLLISACRLVPQKRVDLLLGIVQQLKASFPGVRLLICGDGPLGPTLRQQAAALGLLEEVRFAGALDDTWPLLCASDALVMTSEREGTSNTLLEAMQAGCAIFATDAGDNSALAGGEAGWTGEVRAMAAALQQTFERPALLARYQAGALQRARAFTVQRMTDTTLGHYRAVLRQAPIGHPTIPAVGRGD